MAGRTALCFSTLGYHYTSDHLADVDAAPTRPGCEISDKLRAWMAVKRDYFEGTLSTALAWAAFEGIPRPSQRLSAELGLRWAALETLLTSSGELDCDDDDMYAALAALRLLGG